MNSCFNFFNIVKLEHVPLLCSQGLLENIKPYESFFVAQRFPFTTTDLFDLWGNTVHHIFSRDLSIIHNPHLEMDFFGRQWWQILFSPLAGSTYSNERKPRWPWMRYRLFQQVNGSKSITNTFHFTATNQRGIKLKLLYSLFSDILWMPRLVPALSFAVGHSVAATSTCNTHLKSIIGLWSWYNSMTYCLNSIVLQIYVFLGFLQWDVKSRTAATVSPVSWTLSKL